MPSNNLNVSLLQLDLHWENVQRNLFSISKELKNIPEKTEVLILPEMFATGFSMNTKELAVSMDGEEVKTLKSWANQYDIAIVGSLMVKEKERFYNRLLWVNPDGIIHTYDKKHLFTYANEHEFYTPGEERLIVSYKGWRFACFVCYDLRFPVWCRNQKSEYDAAIYVANWPQKRSLAWKSLLIARAIENQAYVIGVNRIGKDGNGIDYSGDSSVIGSSGSVEASALENESTIISTSLKAQELSNHRMNFPVLKDADSFELKKGDD